MTTRPGPDDGQCVRLIVTGHPRAIADLVRQLDALAPSDRGERHRLAVLTAALRRALRHGHADTHLHPS